MPRRDSQLVRLSSAPLPMTDLGMGMWFYSDQWDTQEVLGALESFSSV